MTKRLPKRYKSTRQRSGKQGNRWLVRLRPAVKENPSQIAVSYTPMEDGRLPGFPRGIKVPQSQRRCVRPSGTSTRRRRRMRQEAMVCFVEAPDKSEASRSTSPIR